MDSALGPRRGLLLIPRHIRLAEFLYVSATVCNNVQQYKNVVALFIYTRKSFTSFFQNIIILTRFVVEIQNLDNKSK